MTDVLRDALTGIHVVALTTNIPGPVAAARLRAMGARVTKIEPLHGDPLAIAAPQWYSEITSSLQVLQLNFRESGARAALDAHLDGADVLLTAMRARSLERIGLRWDEVHARHPRLSMIALSGEPPPDDDRAGHDLTYQARAGTIAPPAMPRALIGDMAAAERVVAMTLAALFARTASGEGSLVNVSIVECARDFAQPYAHGMTRPDGSLGGALPAYGLYEARDGWVAVAALEPHFLERLMSLLGIEFLTREAIAAAIATRRAIEWETLAQAHDVPIAVVR
ncbi:MAG TPA: CoA transferase [Candidatus Aquilonibacter sp.]|nr:CoA transferase [Candidatus Aquilonibacter sp.]